MDPFTRPPFLSQKIYQLFCSQLLPPDKKKHLRKWFEFLNNTLCTIRTLSTPNYWKLDLITPSQMSHSKWFGTKEALRRNKN